MTKKKRNRLLFLLLVLYGAYYFCAEYLDDPLDVAWWWLADKFSATSPGTLEKWTDYAAEGFAGGSGTEDDPYLIATAEQLAYLAKTVNGSKHWSQASFKLISNIDLAGREWVPIGTVDVPFLGTFYGGGHTISNLTITGNLDYQGLFGFVQSSLRVHNLVMLNVNVSGRYCVGALVGLSCKKNIFANINISGRIEGVRNVGGLVGYSKMDAIVECTISIDLKGERRIGGIAGLVEAGVLRDSSFTGSVRGEKEVGGLVGYEKGVPFPQRAPHPAPPDLPFAKILASFSSGDISGKKSVGGLVGRVRYAWLLDCIAYGKVGGHSRLGGLFGKSRGANILYCSSFAHIDRQSFSLFRQTGGIGGSLVGGIIENCASNEEVLPLFGSLGFFARRKQNIAFAEKREGDELDCIVLRRGQMLSCDISLRVGGDRFEMIPRNLAGLCLERYRDCIKIDWKTFAPTGNYTLLVTEGKTVKPLQVKVYGNFEETAQPRENWIDFASNFFAGGDGTKEAPYLISTPEQLAHFAKICSIGPGNNVNEPSSITENFKMTNDIDLAGRNWNPVHSFSGTFDGNNKKISNLECLPGIESTNVSGLGFFKNITDASVSDLHIQNANILTMSDTGILAARLIRSSVVNCTVSGNIYGRPKAIFPRGNWGIALTGASALYSLGEYIPPRPRNSIEGWGIGGLVGISDESTIKNVVASVNIYSFAAVGGLIGYAVDSQILCSGVNGNVTIEGDSLSDVGLFIGEAGNVSSQDCFVGEGVDLRRDKDVSRYMKLIW